MKVVLAVEMSVPMRRAVSRATDALGLPEDQDFALQAMGMLLRSTGFAPKNGRPMGYRKGRATATRKVRR